jgi:hypothetical protein
VPAVHRVQPTDAILPFGFPARQRYRGIIGYDFIKSFVVKSIYDAKT